MQKLQHIKQKSGDGQTNKGNRNIFYFLTRGFRGFLFHIRIMKIVNSKDKEECCELPFQLFWIRANIFTSTLKMKTPLKQQGSHPKPEGHCDTVSLPVSFISGIRLPGFPFLSPSEWSLVWPAGPCLFLNVPWTHKITGCIGDFALRSNVCHCWFWTCIFQGKKKTRDPGEGESQMNLNVFCVTGLHITQKVWSLK